jgi:anti-sigma-K factor RskA
MSGPRHPGAADLRVLAGEAVLGLLPAAEAAALERRARQEAPLAGAFAFWRERLLDLDLSAPRVVPSPRLWQRIERGLDAPLPADDGPTGAGRLWRSLGFWRGLGAGMATAAATLLLVLLLGLGRGGAPAPVAVALLLSPDDGIAGAVVEAYADGSVELLPLVEIAVPQGRVLQVWTLWDPARGPVPLGLLQAAVPARLEAAGLPRPVARQLYEITLEPAGGSPTGRPTGPVLFKGLAVALP